MDQDIRTPKLPRTLLLNRLVAAIRASQNATEMFDEAHAQLLGINQTDARCLDIIQRFGAVTAGQLAEQSGLTTGAVTTVIDRLEKAGYAKRVRSATDRRKVHLELTEDCRHLSGLVYGALGGAFNGPIADYSDDDLFAIARFCEMNDAIYRSLAGLLRQQTPVGKSNAADRRQRAKSFAREAQEAARIAVSEWASGKEPENAYLSGKSMTGTGAAGRPEACAPRDPDQIDRNKA